MRVYLLIAPTVVLPETGHEACHGRAQVVAFLISAIPGLITAFLSAAAASGGSTFGAKVVEAVMTPAQSAPQNPELARANQALADALRQFRATSKDTAPDPDTVYSAADAMQVVLRERPDYISQTQQLIKKLDPPKYEFGQAIGTAVAPAIATSQPAQSLLTSIGPGTDEPSTAQMFVMPEVQKLNLPTGKLPWPTDNTKFVWPTSYQLPSTPSSFSLPKLAPSLEEWIAKNR